MNQEIKKIPFGEDELLGVRTEDGKVWLGVKKVCLNIGLNENQARKQIQKIQTDLLYNKTNIVWRKLSVKLDTQVREIVVIHEEFVPIWLGQIALTPTMQRENPKTVEKLLTYQLKVKSVLSDYFTSTEEKRKEFYSDLGLEDKIVNLSVEIATLKQEMKIEMIELSDQMQSLSNYVTINSHQSQKLLELAKNRVNTLLGGARSEKYKQYSRMYFKNLWLGLGHELKVSSYKDLNPVHMSDAVNYIKTWDYVGV